MVQDVVNDSIVNDHHKATPANPSSETLNEYVNDSDHQLKNNVSIIDKTPSDAEVDEILSNSIDQQNVEHRINNMVRESEF